MNILGTGLSGLVGSRVTQMLAPEFTFENLSPDTGVDITDVKSVTARLEKTDAPWVFHMAAYTDVQGAERTEKDIAWKVNVEATQHIADICKKLNKRLLYIDTDYAFDGKNKSYTEEDTPNPLGWYAKTKTEGAKRVLAIGGLVIRISNPYRAHPVGKKDFVHKMIERMQAGEIVSAPTDQIFAPTFIDDIAAALRVLVKVGASGMYHVVGSPLTPYEAASIIAEIFEYNTGLVEKSTFAEMFANRAPAPQYAALRNDKIKALGVVMHSFREGIAEVKKQEFVVQ